MNRKEFIKKSSLAGLGLGLSTDLIFGQNLPKIYKVAIVGAGISGVYLGKSLKEKGHDVSIFEAKDRAGGRIFEDKRFYSSPIDLGAQWIHGKNELYKIGRQKRIQIYQDTNNDAIKIPFKDSILDDFPPEFYRFIKEINKKTPLKQDVSVRTFAEKMYADPDFLALVENAVTDTATRANRVSINEISKLTEKLKTTDYLFSGSTMYGFVEDNYLSSLRSNITFNSPITSIEYTGKKVILTNGDNNAFDFDKVIITIPITELKSNKIQFIPELPMEKKQAIGMIGMDKGLKVFLKFERRFYNHGIFNGKFAGYYIDASKNSGESGESLLASLIMGKQADLYYENPEKAIQNYLFELDSYFSGMASKHFLGSIVMDWGNDPYINGVYSYTLPGGRFARQIAKKSIDGKLFFAGEAMNTKKNYGNVHGSIETAMDVLREI